MHAFQLSTVNLHMCGMGNTLHNSLISMGLSRKGRKKLAENQRYAIAAMHAAGHDTKQIAKSVGVHRASVYRVIKLLRTTGSTKKVQSGKKGRPRKTTPEMDECIVSEADKNRKLLPKELQKILKERYNIQLGLTQIRQRLLKAGLMGGVCVRKPLLKVKNKLKRLVWAIRHRHWTFENWKAVMWTDEKKFELFNGKRRTYCRRRKGEALREDTIQATVKHGGGSAMFWGSVGNCKTGKLDKIEGIMEKNKYLSVLDKQAIPSGEALFGGEHWTFQQDNDPKHSSKLCKTFLNQQAEAKRFSVMEWPPQSPDLSPIELLWDEVDRQVQATRPSNLTQLENAVRQVWENITEDTLNKLIRRMPRLCEAVINAKGGYFDEHLCTSAKRLVYH
jgi:transposase